jgi:hypothetical protein
VTGSDRASSWSRRALRWGWPLLLLGVAWLWAPVRARSDYPGMPCTSGVSTGFMVASYSVLFIPTAVLLLLLGRWARRARARGRRAIVAGLAILGAVVSVAYLLFAGLSVPVGEQAVTCPSLGGSLTAIHCWRSGTTFELNALGRRPQDPATLRAVGQTLAAHRQDAVLSEAFVYDTQDQAIIDYSNARLFLLGRSDLTAFGDLCLSERQARAAAVASHRVGFYRYSVQQTPPVDAFFLQDPARSGGVGYEVIDYRHGGEALPYVQPSDLRPEESQYLDRVAASLTRLNADLDREQRTNAPPSALRLMRTDFEAAAASLAAQVPARLHAYRDSRLKRFLENYDLIVAGEENARAGQNAQKIHSSAYEQHREFYYQEPRVTRLIGYLYLQSPGQSFSDDELSTVNWAVF